ncbi:hypothetical protein BC628DRAFT_1424131 [Trametes gibbosa]|nr:hypothetical protein BC628DRAFT_1424131 [Trametes gibbosa]
MDVHLAKLKLGAEKNASDSAVSEQDAQNVVAGPGRRHEDDAIVRIVWGHVLPTELLAEILLSSWLDIRLFDPIGRWDLFSRLSLVNRRFRGLALWMATRHVRVLGHCSMDVAAYTSIGRQSLSLRNGHSASAPTSQASAEQLKSIFKNSRVFLDASYVSYTAWYDGDRWLKDNISPGRPDEIYGVHFDALAGPFGNYTYPHPERREPEYRKWLQRRKRDCLSGWFADLLAAIPDCTVVIVSADETIEPLSAVAYAALLEAFWWWRSVERMCWRTVPSSPSFLAEMAGTRWGPNPPLPELPGVRQVWMRGYPWCTCRKGLSTVHKETCMIRLVLMPFPGVKLVRIGDEVKYVKDIVVARPGVEVRVGTDVQTYSSPIGLLPENNDPLYKFGGRVPPPRWVHWLNISSSDTLWEIVDPTGLRHVHDDKDEEYKTMMLAHLREMKRKRSKT